jgi:hypothetical protein
LIYCTPAELEKKIVEVHALSLEAERLAEKYKAELAADERSREQFRAEANRVR